MRKIVKQSLLTVLLLVPVLCLTACGVHITDIGLPPDATITKGDSTALEVGFTTEEQDLTDEALLEAVSELDLVWVSSDESVATVDETGLVTAVGPGDADITVSTTVGNLDLSSTTHITVEVPLDKVEALESINLVINKDDQKSASVEAKLVPEDATGIKLVYRSSDESVATVDDSGTVTAVGNGECIITTEAWGEDVDPPATDQEPLDGEVVGEADTDGDGEPDKTISVPDNLDPNFAVVPDAWKAETKVTVTTLAEAVNLESTEGILTVGGTYTIKATLSPEDTTLAKLLWSSNNEDVATVDENGKVTAKAKGSATITATSEDGAASADYTMTVNAVKCSYCGKEGHTSTNCPQKAADQKAAAQKAAQQAAAQQAAAAQAAAQQAAEQQAAQQAAEQAAQQAAEQQAAQQQAQQQDSHPAGWDPYYGAPGGYNYGEEIPGLGDTIVVPGPAGGYDWSAHECP